MFSSSKEKDVFDMIYEHTELVEKTLNALNETINLYLDKDPSYERKSYETHVMEHDADLMLEKIRHKLFDGAFFLGIRSDLTVMTGKIDEIASCAVRSARKLVEEQPDFPEELKDDMRRLCQESIKVAIPLKIALSLLKEDIKRVMGPCDEVRLVEHNVDSYLHKIIKKIFRLNIDLAHKMQLREWFVCVHKITDIAEDVVDILNLVVMNMKI